MPNGHHKRKGCRREQPIENPMLQPGYHRLEAKWDFELRLILRILNNKFNEPWFFIVVAPQYVKTHMSIATCSP